MMDPFERLLAQGEQPHCGFPEVNYLMHAERLVRAGLRVVVVEQTETPDMLRIRNEQRPAGQAKVTCKPLAPVFFWALYLLLMLLDSLQHKVQPHRQISTLLQTF